ncbi:hypothetical protein D3C87_152550 [compost metagenome]
MKTKAIVAAIPGVYFLLRRLAFLQDSGRISIHTIQDRWLFVNKIGKTICNCKIL